MNMENSEIKNYADDTTLCCSGFDIPNAAPSYRLPQLFNWFDNNHMKYQNTCKILSAYSSGRFDTVL